MRYIIVEKDTMFVDELRGARVFARLPRQKGKEWRKYYRLVHNFSKTYPYALAARKIVKNADQTIAENNLKNVKRDRYINKVQGELFDTFEEPLRKMTVSQGALLMKLIDREIGKSSYAIIKDYKSGIAAGCTSVLVLSGETDEAILAASPEKPDIVLADAGEILKWI
jgi:hypothetical protein